MSVFLKTGFSSGRGDLGVALGGGAVGGFGEVNTTLEISDGERANQRLLTAAPEVGLTGGKPGINVLLHGGC